MRTIKTHGTIHAQEDGTTLCGKPVSRVKKYSLLHKRATCKKCKEVYQKELEEAQKSR